MTFNIFIDPNDVSLGDFHPDQALVRRVQLARNMRADFFGENLFGDPAWDILLELYGCELGQGRISVSSAGVASGVPPTTALRWIAVLEGRDLVERERDRSDGRRAWISLTSHGKSLMHSYFSARLATFLPE